MYTSHFEGATGEAGDPSEAVNPPAPKGSRVFGDPFVHYIEDSITGETLIRFWFPEKQDSRTLPIDFEVLKPVASWLKNQPLNIEPEVVIKLIIFVFFQEFIDDFYQDKIDTLSFKCLKTNWVKDIPYPRNKIFKHDIV